MNKRIKFAVALVAAAALAIPLSLGSGIYASAASTPISAGSGQGVIAFHAHRVSSTDWASCFALTCNSGTGPGATMYFVVYDSVGALVAHGFADESGTQITGLTVGQTYSIYPADCDLCHNSTHNVVFDHWGDNSTVRPRPFMVTSSPLSVDAYYKIVELGASASSGSASTGGSGSSGTASTPPETQPPISSVGLPPAVSTLPKVGNTGHESASVTIIKVLGYENVVVITHGKEVFKVPLNVEGHGHQEIHLNAGVHIGQTEIQKYAQDGTINLPSLEEHVKARDAGNDNGGHQGDNGGD